MMRRLYNKRSVFLIVALIFALFAVGASTVLRSSLEGYLFGRIARTKTFDVAVGIVDEMYYDRNFNGLDWVAVKSNYRIKAKEATSTRELYWQVLSPMLAFLESSHTSASPPSLYRGIRRPNNQSEMTVIEPTIGRCFGAWLSSGIPGKLSRVVAVARGSPADSAGIKAGWRLYGTGKSILDNLQQPISFVDKSGSVRSVSLMANLKPGPWATGASVKSDPTSVYRALRSFGIRLAEGRMASGLSIALVDPGSRAALAGFSPRSSIIGFDASRDIDQFVSLTLEAVNDEGLKTRFSGRIFCPAEIKIPTIVKSVSKEVVYIRFDRFDLSAVDALQRAINIQARAMIIDLRHNTGGSLNVLRTIMGHFFTSDVIIGRSQKREKSVSIFPTRSSTIYKGRLLVLTSSISASAAEVMAESLQSHSRASLYGSTTSGEVQISKSYRLPDGGVIQVAEESFLTVGGKPLEGVGVNPDIVVPERLTEKDEKSNVLSRALSDLKD
jgi:C-terminal processing protease CtpA/Prc